MNVLQESLKLIEIQFLYPCEAEVFKEAVQVNVLRVYLETKFSHHHFQLVLKELVLLGILSKIILKNGVDKHLVPG